MSLRKKTKRRNGGQRWVRVPVSAAPLPSGELLVRRGGTPACEVLTLPLYRILQRCESLKAFNDQARLILADSRVPVSASTIRISLDSLARRGFLQPEEEITSSLRRHPGLCGTSSHDVVLSRVAWPTRNRPELLYRSIQSWDEAIARHGRTADLLICDDSDSHIDERVRHTLSRYSRRSRGSVRFFGRTEKREVLSLMEQSGLSRDLLEYAFGHAHQSFGAYGANRNWLLLANLGESFVCVDDDTTCSMARPRDAQNGIGIASAISDEMFQFFESREKVLEAVLYAEVDPFQELERLLSAPLADALRSEEETSRLLGDATWDALQALLRPRAHVALACRGFYGDAAGINTRLLLRLEGAHRERVGVASEYARAIASTEGVVIPRQATVARRLKLVSTCFALRSVEAVPPFSPIGRGEDTLWSTTAPWVMPNALFAVSATGILHDGRPRNITRKDVVSAGMNINACLESLARCCLPHFFPKEGPQRRLRRMGKLLTELGQVPWDEFADHLRHGWSAQTEKTVQHLESLLLIHNRQPANWAADVDAHIESLQQYAVSEDFAIPVELRTHADGRPRSQEEARRLLQDLVRKYGELLIAWPDMVGVAKELKAAERFPMTRLG